MKKKIPIAVSFLILIYFLSYSVFRQSNAAVWEKDNRTYVIFPADKVYLYYIFRPISYIDGTLTGIRFHIGVHQ